MNIGKILYGYCNGFFGRESWGDKIIVYETSTCICVRYLNSEDLDVAYFESAEQKQMYIDAWSIKLEDYE